MDDKNVGRDSDKFMLRFPDGMRDALKADAAKNGRSMNTEIVARLEHYETLLDRVEELESTVRGHDADLAAIVKERDLLQDEVHRLRASQASASPVLQPITPEAFDKLFAEVQETKKAVLSFASFQRTPEDEAEEEREFEDDLFDEHGQWRSSNPSADEIRDAENEDIDHWPHEPEMAEEEEEEPAPPPKKRDIDLA